MEGPSPQEFSNAQSTSHQLQHSTHVLCSEEPSSGSLILCLPVEIAHMICAQLSPRQIAKLRLVCKAFAAIGLHHLKREIHLIFESSSFQRLREFAEHPIISQCITSLFYEADALESYGTMRKWKENILVPGWMDNLPAGRLMPPLATASQREHRAYRRDMERACQGPRFTHSDVLLRRAYETYKEHLSDQDAMRAQEYNAESLRDAVANFPNLNSIIMSMECCFNSRSTKIERAFGDGLQAPYGDSGQVEKCGVPQLRSLLLAAENAGLKLEKLCCGNIDWRFFKQDGEILLKLNRAVRFLHSMTLHVSTSSGDGIEDEDEDDYHHQIPTCAEYLKQSGHLREFMTAAPDLRSLEIKFDFDNPFPPALLSDIVGDVTWHRLTFAAFSRIRTTGEELLQFYSRHAATLEDIYLDNIQLSCGTWPSLLQKIRKTLCLKKATIAGQLSAVDADKAYYLGLTPEINGGKKEKMGKIVEEYLVKGGDGPLFPLDHLADIPSEWIDTDLD